MVCGQVLQFEILQGLKPELLFLGDMVACPSMSFMIIGRWEAVMGGSGMAFLHLSDRCRMGRYFLKMLEMLGSGEL